MMEGFSPPLLLVLTLLLSHICTCCNAGGASSPSSDPTATPSTRKPGPPASSGPTATPSTRKPGPPASSGPTASPSTRKPGPPASSGPTASPSIPKPGPPASHAGGPAASPEPGPPSSRGGGPVKSTLDPRQLSALQSMGLPTARDPCAQPSPHDNATACDNAAPFRHLVSLRLANCSPDLDISPTALHDLSTLRSLSFLHCPITPPKHFPAPLVASLQSFSCIDSLRHLSGVWLSRLSNLTDLSVINVPVAASGPWIIVSRLPRLRSLTISNANLSGGVPHYWHALGLAHVDLSANHLTGPVPTSIGMLGSLESLNLSSNSLAGVLPDAISDLVSLKIASFSQNSLSGPIPDAFSELPALVHLDLSSNQFNGTIPKFLSGMKGLRYLNLENNNLHGVIPFNASFIKRLEVFKVGGNSNLCYNHTLLSSKLGLSIAPCDKYGLPVSPPPDRRADSSDYSGDDGDDDDDSDSKGKSGGGHHGPSKMVLGVAIALSCLVFLVIFIVCISKCCG